MEPVNFCPRCGEKREGGLGFCGSCSFDYNAPGPAAAVQDAPPPPTPAPPASVQNPSFMSTLPSAQKLSPPGPAPVLTATGTSATARGAFPATVTHPGRGKKPRILFMVFAAAFITAFALFFFYLIPRTLFWRAYNSFRYGKPCGAELRKTLERFPGLLKAQDKEDRRTALHWAARNANAEAVEALIARGADINARDRADCTPLNVFAREGQGGQQDMVSVNRILLDRGADARIADTLQNTPLHNAAETGRAAIPGFVDLFLSHGISVNITNVYKKTPLHIAAEKGNIAVAKTLLLKGADVNARESNGMTPLDYAEWLHKAEMARFLRSSGAKKGK